jgi:hypothetical protein
MWRHFMWPNWGKKFKPRVRPFSRKPLHKNDIPLQGYMVFRSNELGQGPDHGIVCWNEAILDTRMSIGTARTLLRLFSILSHGKRVFHFWSTEIRILCEAATETTNQKLATTPHINSRPREMRISALISTRKPFEVYSKFCVSSYRFRWKRGVFAL